jgi:[acyl-carrier-protein] S-malonyltransferase
VAGEVLQIANLLCPGNVVVSGHWSSCQRVPAAAQAVGAMRSIPLNVAGAFHTPLMQSASQRLSRALNQARFVDTRIPVISNVNAAPHQSAADFAKLLMQQLCYPVMWHRSMEYLIEQGFDEFYEIGPGRVLKGLMKRIHRGVRCEAVVE